MKRPAASEDDSKIQPCHHMEKYVSALSDSTLSGPALWYTKLHMLHCTPCRKALQALQALRDRLRGLGASADGEQAASLTSERRAALEKAMDSLDQS